MRVSTAESSNNVRAEQLIAALIRHSGNISPQQAYRAAQSITEEFSLQPRNLSYTMSGGKSGKKTKKSKPSKTGQNTVSSGFCHVHESSGDVGQHSTDLTFQQSSIDWERQGNQLVINLSRKQVKRLRAALTAYLYSTQQSGEEIPTDRSSRAAAA